MPNPRDGTRCYRKRLGRLARPTIGSGFETPNPDPTFCPIVALKLLPETAAQSLRQNPVLLHSWIQTLQGRQDSKIAKIVNPAAMEAKKYVTPEERVEPFIGYLRNEIRAKRTNQPQYAIHLSPAGLISPKSGYFPGLRCHSLRRPSA